VGNGVWGKGCVWGGMIRADVRGERGVGRCGERGMGNCGFGEEGNKRNGAHLHSKVSSSDFAVIS
jgi:hypothetical protein